MIPFAATREERLKNNDPRLSIGGALSKQGDRAAAIAKASAELVRDRLLLEDDARLFIANVQLAPRKLLADGSGKVHAIGNKDAKMREPGETSWRRRKRQQTIERRTIAKVSWRLLPLVALAYCIAYIDRSNISFAALTMNKDLGFSAYIYGWGAGIFFFGYFLFEIPSNLILEKVGARIWIARIMITWGIISGADRFRHRDRPASWSSASCSARQKPDSFPA